MSQLAGALNPTRTAAELFRWPRALFVSQGGKDEKEGHTQATMRPSFKYTAL